jgi:hypothetical protein
MGSVGLGNNAKLGAFQNKIHQEGLDLGRCQIREAPGIFVADPANTFNAGMAVMLDTTTGLVVPSDGTGFLGVAKWNHATALVAAVVDEAVVLTGTTAASLAHANVSNVAVNSAAGMAAATLFTVTTDYTVSATNGTVTRVALGSITDGATVYVSYHYSIPTSDLTQTQGQNFWNTLDEVSQADGRVTVITGSELLFTTQFDSSVGYAIDGAVYASTTAGKEGLFTSSSAGSAKFVGRVFQVPSASDPYIGLRLVKGPVA